MPESYERKVNYPHRNASVSGRDREDGRYSNATAFASYTSGNGSSYPQNDLRRQPAQQQFQQSRQIQQHPQQSRQIQQPGERQQHPQQGRQTQQHGGQQHPQQSQQRKNQQLKQKQKTQRQEQRQNSGRHPQAQDGQQRNAAAGNAPAAMPKGKARYFYDYTLLFAVIFIFALGLIIIYSGSQYAAVLDNKSPEFYFRKQLRYGCFGLAGAVFLSILNYRWLVKIWNAFFSKAAYVLSVLLLAATELSGLASHGKTRWLSIGGRSFQTAELVKIGLIVFFAYFISKNMREDNQREIAGKVIIMAVIPVVMILTQNISSAFIVAMIVAVMIFVSVKNYKVFAALGAATVAGLVSAKPLVRLAIEKNIISGRPSQYWMRRIVGWAAPEVFPDDAYQTVQSLYAIGSGGMTGHGLGESIQKFGKIPEVQNDMIFSIVCEEFGVIGAATLFLVFFYILYRIYEVARNAEDIHGTLLCTGVLAHLGIQIVLNIAVVTGVIPNTGVTLPFISYGGTALIVTMLEIGVVLSVAHKIKTGER